MMVLWLERGSVQPPSRQPATLSALTKNPVSPIIATHPKISSVTPFLATLTKTKDLKSFACHTFFKFISTTLLRLTWWPHEDHPHRRRRTRRTLRHPPRPGVQVPHRRS